MARFATDIIEPIKQKIKKPVSGPLADIALNEIADNETCQFKSDYQFTSIKVGTGKSSKNRSCD